MHESIEAALRQSRDVRLLSFVDLIQLIRAERYDPHFAIGHIDAIGAFEILAACDLLRLGAGDVPDRIGTGRLEVSARSRFHAHVRSVDALSVAGGVIHESASL